MRRYRARHLAGFLAAGAALTLSLWWGIPHVVEPWLENPKPLHDFFYDRSPIQWVILLALFSVLSLLAHRIHEYRHLASTLDRGVGRDGDATRLVYRLVAERLEDVRRCKAASGPEGAARYCAELAEEDEAHVERTYGLVSGVAQLMLALGFLGTVFGISQSIFGSFQNLGEATTEELKNALQIFTSALGTALDTTVLAIVCSLIATVSSTLAQWLERSALGELDVAIRGQLWLGRSARTSDEGWRRLESRLESLPSEVARRTAEALRAQTPEPRQRRDDAAPEAGATEAAPRAERAGVRASETGEAL